MVIFFIGTVFATLGIGEHYFVDLVAAFPFALMIFAACALNVPIRNPRRMVALAAGLAMMAGWVVLLRWGLPVMWINPALPNMAIPWLLVAGTISLTLFLLARLQPAVFDRVRVRVRVRVRMNDRGMGES